MSLSIILESLKFYKLKHEKTLQLWFLLLCAMNIGIYFLPFIDTDFSAFYYWLDELAAVSVPNLTILQSLTGGNWYFMGLSVLMTLVSAFFGLMYATLFVGERDGMMPRQAVVRSLAALPRLLLLAILLLVPALLSLWLLFIPLVVFAFMMFFMPLNLTLEKNKLSEAMQNSYLVTRQQKLFLFIQTVFLSMIISLPHSLISGIFAMGILATAIISAFFTALQTFMQARLMGLLYVILVKKDQSVLPSKTKE